MKIEKLRDHKEKQSFLDINIKEIPRNEIISEST